MIKNKIKIIAITLFLFLGHSAKSHEVTLPNFGFICVNITNNEKYEFIFSRNDNDTNDIVFRRINGKFKFIGNVLAQKSGSYVLWEDKNFYKTTDFAWNLDKVTSILTPIILSIGLDIEDKSKIPIKMTCNSRSIYY
tara:strand:+ start:122 stop:532 length:411 start_codon:yes stop_codon:yes gene_type:complete